MDGWMDIIMVCYYTNRFSFRLTVHALAVLYNVGKSRGPGMTQMLQSVLVFTWFCNFNPESFSWRYPRKGCQKVVSLRHGSFFHNSKLPIENILRLIHLWSTGHH